MNSVQTAVATQITAISPQVEAKVVDALVARELNKRSDALVLCMDALAKLEADQLKIKPDQVSYNADGTVASSFFSKGKLDENKKLSDKITKYTNAIGKALEKADFGDVYNLNKNQGQTSGPEKSGGDES